MTTTTRTPSEAASPIAAPWRITASRELSPPGARLVTSTVPASSSSIHAPTSPSAMSRWPARAFSSSMAPPSASASSVVKSSSSAA